MQTEWSVVHFLEDHSLSYVPSSWITCELLQRRDGQRREVFNCYWPVNVNDDAKIRSWIRSCSQPDREEWALLRCKVKGVFHSTDAALRALRNLEGTSSTTDTDAVSQRDLTAREQNTAEKTHAPSDNSTFQIDRTLVSQLLQNGVEHEHRMGLSKITSATTSAAPTLTSSSSTSHDSRTLTPVPSSAVDIVSPGFRATTPSAAPTLASSSSMSHDSRTLTPVPSSAVDIVSPGFRATTPSAAPTLASSSSTSHSPRMLFV